MACRTFSLDDSMRIATQFFLLSAVLSFLGCGGESVGESELANAAPIAANHTPAADDLGISPTAEKHLELLLKRAQWASQGMLEYQFSFRAEAALHEPIEVTLHVSDDQLVGAYARDTGAWIDPQTYQGLRSIGDVFDTVEGLISAQPDALSVIYDQEFGFPVQIDMDFRHDWHDDHYSWSFSDFAVIRASDGPARARGASDYLTF